MILANGGGVASEFKIGDLFNVLPSSLKLSKADISTNGAIPIYAADSSNNGIIGYCEKTPNYVVDKNSPFYVIFGDHTRTMNIAKNSFCIADNVKVLLPKFKNIKVALFIFAVWHKIIPNLGYARHWSIAKKSILNLPTKNNAPDYEFMSDFIKAVQKLVIKDVVLWSEKKIEATKSVI